MSSENKKLKVYENRMNTMDIYKRVLENVIKMLINRNVLDAAKEKEHQEMLFNKIDHNLMFRIKSDYGKEDYLVKFFTQKFTTINKIPGINDLFSQNKKVNKIIVVRDAAVKAKKQFLEFDQTEIFDEKDLMIDKVSHFLVPKHRVLSNEESANFLKEYNLTRKELAKIKLNDPIARYYKMQVGDIVEITRSSNTTIQSRFYRVVVKAPLVKSK